MVDQHGYSLMKFYTKQMLDELFRSTKIGDYP